MLSLLYSCILIVAPHGINTSVTTHNMEYSCDCQVIPPHLPQAIIIAQSNQWKRRDALSLLNITRRMRANRATQRKWRVNSNHGTLLSLAAVRSSVNSSSTAIFGAINDGECVVLLYNIVLFIRYTLVIYPAFLFANSNTIFIL